MRAETYEHDERVQARKSVAHAEEGSRTTTCSEAQPPMAAHASLGARVRFAIRRFVQCTGKKTPGGAGTHTGHTGTVQCLVQRHRGEPGHTRADTRTSQTNLKTNPTHRLTRQTTPEPRDARVAVHTPHRSPDQALWW